MKHGYTKRRMNQPMKIQIDTFERLVFYKRKYEQYEKYDFMNMNMKFERI